MKFVSRSLAWRMVALILLGAGFVVLLVQGYNHFVQRRRMLDNDLQAGSRLAQSLALHIEAALGRAESVVQQTACSLTGHDIRRQDTADLIRRTLQTYPGIFGISVALAEWEAGRSDFRMLYGWRDTEGIAVTDRGNPLADYQQDWFVLPYYLKRPAWVEPYYDQQAVATMVTYAVPVLRTGEVVAVVTCDLSLSDIRTRLAQLPLGKEGMSVLISRRGTFIAHPNRPMLEMKESIFSLGEGSANREVGQTLYELGREMLGGVPGHKRYRRPYADDIRVAHMYYDTVPCTGWAVGVFWPEDQVLAPLVQLNKISALVAVASLLLLILPALGIAWSIARPLHHLANSAQRLATGDFDAPLPAVRTRDEVARLTGAFDKMRQDLRRYISDLTATTAAKERIAGELSAAREIQMSIVPKLFPPFPNRPDIDLYAMLIPALEVGGDLYDFALLDDDHLYVAIGDVSGKGVPASLLMAVGKTLLKSTVQSLRDPARALAHVNAELSEDNESCMFITMFCAILNLRTGDLIYASAGHNPPLLVRASGDIERMDDKPSPALGAAPSAVYHDHSRRLNDHDLLILYTDGVTEAMNPDRVMFGEKGLTDYVRREFQSGARPLLDGLGHAVHLHADGAPQSDDITALAVRFLARPPSEQGAAESAAAAHKVPDATISLRNHLDELPRLAAWIEDRSEALHVPPALCMKLNLALEEWVVNVISYAYDDRALHTIELRLWRGDRDLRIEVEDDGQPFDPTAQAEADTTMPIEHRSIGGLGIHFIRKTVDRFTYRRENNRNIVTLVKVLDGGAA